MDAQTLKTEMKNIKDELSQLIQTQTSTLNNTINEFKAYIGNELNKVKQNVEDLSDRVKTAEQNITDNTSSIERAEQVIKANSTSIEQTHQTLQNRITELENKLSSQVDRSLRCTLTFRGVFEEENENYNKTPKILANALSKMDPSNKHKWSYQKILDCIDRAHRGNRKTTDVPPNSNPEPHQQPTRNPRPIFVKFSTWKAAEYLKSLVIRHNKNLLAKNRNPSIFVDNMFSKRTNFRRKLAYDKMKSLQESGVTLKMHINYPAVLMIMNNETKTFIEHSSF